MSIWMQASVIRFGRGGAANGWMIIFKNGDRIDRILLSFGIQRLELHGWYKMLLHVNTHNGNLDRIRGGDSVLIPDMLNEFITEHVIWGNAFSAYPHAYIPWRFLFQDECQA